MADTGKAYQVTATCDVCTKRITVTRAGTLRAHGHPARRCPGTGQMPLPWTRTTGGADHA